MVLIVYGFVASVLPVWLLLAPRDYLSTFMKIGTITLLAVGIVIAQPVLQAPAVSQFAHDGERAGLRGLAVPVPVHHHRLRRAVGLPRADLVGHHAEADGEGKPDAADRLRRHADGVVRRGDGNDRARILDQHLYFAMNAPGRAYRRHRRDRRRRAAISLGCPELRSPPQQLTRRRHDVGEKTIVSRTGGAPTLAVGMSEMLQQVPRRRRPQGLLVPLRDHVRGAVHPDHRRRRHPGGPVHAVGHRWATSAVRSRKSRTRPGGRARGSAASSWSRPGARSC